MLLLETFVEKKFKFVLEMRTAKEFEKELRCIGENTPKCDRSGNVGNLMRRKN
jgi:hypothetical protein